MLVDCQRETVLFYINNDIALLLDAQTKEVVGIQVESFKKTFLKRNVKLQQMWKIQKGNTENSISDLGDLFNVRKRREPAVAQEVVRITEELILA